MALKSTLSKKSENKEHNFAPKFDIEKKYLSLGSAQGESEAFYDDDNYLKPAAINASVKMKIGYGKPLPKLPPPADSNSSKYRKDRNKTPSAFRDPIPPPREDTEENVYEPAPNTSAVANNSARSYSSSNGIEEDNVYEPPPILPHKFQQQNTTKFYLNSTLSNNRNVDNLQRNYTNVEIKRDFSPSLPPRTMSLHKATKTDNHNRKNPPYTNVVNQLSEENFMHRSPSSSDGNEVIMKNFSRLPPKSNDSNIEIPEDFRGERSGISGRPLPPLPRRNSMHESRMQMNEKLMLHEEKISGEKLKFYSLRKTSFPTEILGKTGNTDESLMPLQSNILQQLRTSNISAFKQDGWKKNDEWNSSADKYNAPSVEQNSSYEDMKSLNANSETKSNTKFLTEIKKVKLRSTKYSLQKDKNTNDHSDESPSTLTSNEDKMKPSKFSQSHKPLLKLISSNLNTSPIANETKFNPTKSRVMLNRNFVGKSAGETETLLENKQKQTNIFNTKVNSNKHKTIVPNGASFSNVENDDDLPNYINSVESKKVFMSSTHAQKKSKDISEGEDKGSAELSHIEETKKNFESSLSPSKGTNQNSNQSIFGSLASRISAVKLKPTTTQIQKKENSVNYHDNEEILPEYINGQELRNSKSNVVTSTTLNKTLKNNNMREINSITPNSQLKHTAIETDPNESSDHENDDEDLPEYGNTKDIMRFAKQPSAATKKSSSTSEYETSNQSPISQLISELSKKNLKPTNYIPYLDDNAAEILKQKLLERKKGNTEDQKETTSKYSPKPPVKLALPPSRLPTTFSNEYFPNNGQENCEDEFQDDYDEFDGVYNLNNEKYYRDIDRKRAEQLLEDLEKGAFVLRPSSQFFLSITVKSEYKCYNLGIKQTKTNHIFCGEGITRSPDFSSVKAFLEYYERYPFLLQGKNGVEEVYLRKVLPDDKF
ncbi:hypothetical protein WA026_014542 [Henosepilachna vigintioctopunctata]